MIKVLFLVMIVFSAVANAQTSQELQNLAQQQQQAQQGVNRQVQQQQAQVFQQMQEEQKILQEQQKLLQAEQELMRKNQIRYQQVQVDQENASTGNDVIICRYNTSRAGKPYVSIFKMIENEQWMWISTQYYKTYQERNAALGMCMKLFQQK